jgi:hypothetical protein
VLLNATDLNGFLNASKDDVFGTTALDFGYAIHDPNPDIQIFVQGAGTIPNTAFTVSTSAATLNVTTPFEITRCVVNTATSEITCAPQAAITFNLTWAGDGFSTTFQKFNLMTTFGPFTMHVTGQSDQASAGVSGSFTGFTITDNSGELQDSKSNTVNRDISL